MLDRWRPLAAGHWWTVMPELWDRVHPVRAPAARRWTTTLTDPKVGPVTLRGALRDEPSASTLLLVVHGLGGAPDSPYCRRVAARAQARGWSCLRLGLRGSEGDGEDLYHAGLDCDLAHALAAPSVARYERVLVIGYSLGGHLTLRHALDPEPRVRAVAAISAPLDLDRSCRAIDRRRAWIYRRHILRGLKDGYARADARRPLTTPAARIERVRTIREWDRLTVVPRFGFADVDEYYRTASVGSRLGQLRVPSLYCGMRHDPMIPPSTVDPSLEATATEHLALRWLDAGGHVAAPGRWEEDVLDWLDQRGR